MPEFSLTALAGYITIAFTYIAVQTLKIKTSVGRGILSIFLLTGSFFLYSSNEIEALTIYLPLFIISMCFVFQSALYFSSNQNRYINTTFYEIGNIIISLFLVATSNILFVFLFVLILEAAKKLMEDFQENTSLTGINTPQLFIFSIFMILFISSTSSLDINLAEAIDYRIASGLILMGFLLIFFKVFETLMESTGKIGPFALLAQRLVHQLMIPIIILRIMDKLINLSDQNDMLFIESIVVCFSAIAFVFISFLTWKSDRMIEVIRGFSSILFINLYLFFGDYNFDQLVFTLVLVNLICSSWEIASLTPGLKKKTVDLIYKTLLLPSSFGPVLWIIIGLLIRKTASPSIYPTIFLLFYIGILAILFPRIASSRYNHNIIYSRQEYIYSIILVLLALFLPLLRII